mmetsp:Transcript_11259/g.38469  ORF Transcript_11259/g.38469 Transcript_11259/m.38469 type:complete len:208 (+) Transcript_11259:918-1541(+)
MRRHHVNSNQSSSPAQTRPAMHSHRPLLILADLEELLHDGTRRGSAVLELQVVVSDPLLLKLSGIVSLRLVETDNGSDAFGLERLYALGGAKGGRILLELSPHVRASEGDELRADDVEVKTWMVPPYVVVQVELVQIEPAQLDCPQEPAEAIEDGEVVLGRAVRGISVRLDGRRFHPLEGSIGSLWGQTPTEHDVGAKEERSVGNRG